jgi:hypothetical protein
VSASTATPFATIASACLRTSRRRQRIDFDLLAFAAPYAHPRSSRAPTPPTSSIAPRLVEARSARTWVRRGVRCAYIYTTSQRSDVSREDVRGQRILCEALNGRPSFHSWEAASVPRSRDCTRGTRDSGLGLLAVRDTRLRPCLTYRACSWRSLNQTPSAAQRRRTRAFPLGRYDGHSARDSCAFTHPEHGANTECARVLRAFIHPLTFPPHSRSFFVVRCTRQ